MNILKYLVSSRYRNKHHEEYSRELFDKFEFQEQEYEKIFKAADTKDNKGLG